VPAPEKSPQLSSLLLPILREQFPGRGLIEGASPNPCAKFPGIHPGIRGVSVYDEGFELTVSVDDLTHGHFSEFDDRLPDTERTKRIVEAVVDFLDALFGDRVAVWGNTKAGGGWYRIDLGGSRGRPGIQEFVWSGLWTPRHV
jgi:hypothetical protein